MGTLIKDNKMKKIIVIVIVIMIIGLSFTSNADPIILKQMNAPFTNNFSAALTFVQTTNFWTHIMANEDIILPSITNSCHVQCVTIILMNDGTSKLNAVFQQDNVQMMFLERNSSFGK